MALNELPKKILIIKDSTFILPENFSGDIEDAFDEFLKYRKDHLDKANYCDPLGLMSTFNALIHDPKESKACGLYMICELIDGQYIPVDATIPKEKK